MLIIFVGSTKKHKLFRIAFVWVQIRYASDTTKKLLANGRSLLLHNPICFLRFVKNESLKFVFRPPRNLDTQSKHIGNSKKPWSMRFSRNFATKKRSAPMISHNKEQRNSGLRKPSPKTNNPNNPLQNSLNSF